MQVVQVTFDPKEVTMGELTKLLFSKINPKLKNQVGNDRGTQYRHGVYYHSEEQRAAAQAVFDEVKKELGGGTFTQSSRPPRCFTLLRNTTRGTSRREAATVVDRAPPRGARIPSGATVNQWKDARMITDITRSGIEPRGACVI